MRNQRLEYALTVLGFLAFFVLPATAAVDAASYARERLVVAQADEAPLGGPGLPGSPPPPGPAEEPAPASDGDAPQGYPAGDVVKLSTGKVLVGVQVLRASPAVVEVQLKPGMEPMKLPRKQVIEIIYDDVDPNAPSAAAPTGDEAGPRLVPADKLSPELNEKLGAPISGTPREVKDQNFVHLLKQIAQELKVEIEFTETLTTMAPEKKKWNTTLPEGTTLRTLLEKDLPTAFPFLDINFDQYNKIVIGMAAGAAA